MACTAQIIAPDLIADQTGPTLTATTTPSSQTTATTEPQQED